MTDDMHSTYFRLSPQQKRWVEVRRAREGEQPWNTTWALRLGFAVDAARFERAVREVCGEIEILRAELVEQPGSGERLQRLAARAEIDFQHVVAPGADEECLDEQIETIEVIEESGSVLVPRLRVVLITADECRHYLVCSVPAIVADHRGMQLIVSELLARYRDSAQRTGAQTRQYLDVVEYLNELVESDEFARGHAVWAERSGTEAPEVALPLAANQRRLPGTKTPRPVSERISDELLDTVQRWCEQNEVSAEAVLLACWASCLAAVARSRSVVVSCQLDGREPEELHTVVGLFAREIPLRFDGLERVDFTAVARDVQAKLQFARTWQEYYRWPDAAYSARAAPFAFEMLDARVASAVPEQVSLCHATSAVDACSLKLTCLRQASGCRVSLQSRHSYLGASALEVLLQQYLQALRSLVGDAAFAGQRALIDVPAHRSAMCRASTGEPLAAPFVSAARLIERQVSVRPDHTALIFGGVRVSYAELDQSANHLARELKGGCAAEEPVAICMQRAPNLIVALLACLKAGRPYVPIDNANPWSRIQYMIENSGARLVLIDDGPVSIDMNANGAPATLNVDRFCAERSRSGSENDSAVEVHPLMPAYVMYTSGSSGRPKGVIVTQEGLSNYLRFCERHYPLDGEAIFHSSIGFDATITSLIAPLVAGGTIRILPQSAGLPELATLLQENRQYSVVKITPAHLDGIATMDLMDTFRSRVGAFVIGGEALWARTLDCWQRAFPHARFINEYGPTEAVVGCCVQDCHRVGADELVPIGRPISNMQVYVLDADLALSPIGCAGEIHIGGVGVARGYVGRPDLTAERFLPDPFASTPGARLYRTGDRGLYRPDGTIQFLGRVDEQVKIRGYRVEPGEIETVIAECVGGCPVVVLAAGEPPQLVAFMAAGTTAPSVAELFAQLRNRLPPYMVPARIHVLSRFPYTGNGKLDARALLERDADRTVRSEYSGPRNALEQRLADVCAEVLGHQVGIHENFFTSGGDSIQSIKVVALARRRGLSFSVRDLYRYQTIAALAACIAEHAAPESGHQVAPFSLLGSEERAAVERAFQDAAEDAFPLTSLQHGMLLHTRLDESDGLPSYIDVSGFDIRGPFDREALQSALDATVQAHPMLRACLYLKGTRPLQVILSHAACPIDVHDLRALGEAEQDNQIRQFTQAERGRRFEFSLAPLMQLTVHWLAENRFTLTFTRHHLILDGWSTGVLLSELFDAYRMRLRGEIRPLEPPVARFREFVALELAARENPEHLHFWREKVRGMQPTRVPALPDHDRLSRRADVDIATVPIDEALSNRLLRISEDESVPLRTMMLAVHLRVLSLLAGSATVNTGVVLGTRPEASGAERTLGLFLNTVPMQVDVGDLPWNELCRRVASEEASIQEHKALPLQRIQAEAGGELLFGTLFNFIHFHVYEQAARSEQFLIRRETDYEKVNYPFVVYCGRRLGGDVMLAIHFACSTYTAEQIRLIGEMYADALRALAERFTDKWRAFADNRQWQFNRIHNRTQRPVVEACIHDLIVERARSWPRRVAVVAGEVSLTYEALIGRAERLASDIQAAGATTGDLVGIVLGRGVSQVVAVLATLIAGAAYLPVNVHLPAQRRRSLLQLGKVGIVLTDAPRLAEFRESGLCAIDVDAERDPRVCRDATSVVTPRDLAYVIFTSGSTGEPKGVAIEHRSALNTLLDVNRRYGIGERDVVLTLAELGFDLSVYDIFGTLLAGGQIVVLEEGAARDPERWLQLIRAHGVTVWNSVPALMAMLTAHIRRFGEHTGSSLRHVWLSGDWIPAGLPDRIRECFGDDVAITSMGGATEASIWSIAYPIPRGTAGWASIPYGRALDNQSVVVLDAQLADCPPLVTGELYIGGIGLAREYWADPVRTAERFIVHPVSGERLYRTGDLGRWLPSGRIEFLGRVDNQVKIRGYRIELNEIDTTLRSAPGVREAVSTVIVDEQGHQHLVSYVVPAKAAEMPDRRALRALVAQQLPAYMVPRVVEIVPALPLGENGKVDRKALPAPTWPEMRTEEFIPPQGPAETKLARIWMDLLNVERVARTDDFFLLGGDSLMTTQLVVRADEIAPRRLTVRWIFEHPTLCEMALAFAGSETLSPAPQPQIPLRQTEWPALSDAQIRMWFLDQLQGEAADYNICVALRLKGDFDVLAAGAALQALVQRHEVLRTSFLEGPSGPYQHVADTVHMDLPVLADGSDIEAWSGDLFSRPFDMRRAPLFRVGFARLREEDGMLLMSMHHIISDGWSMAILVDEFAELYRAARSGEASALPPLTLQYADYSVWQQAQKGTDEYVRCIEFWRESLATAPRLLELSITRPRSGAGCSPAARVPVRIPAPVTARLRVLCENEHATLFMALLCAYQILLARYDSSRDILVGVPVASRPSLQLERLIGNFLNTLVLRTHVNFQRSFQELLREVRATSVQAFEHQQASFEDVLSALQVERVAAYNPLVQMLFVFQNAPRTELDLAGVSGEVVRPARRTTTYDLMLELTEGEGAIEGFLEYRRDLFDAEDVERFAGQFVALLTQVSVHPTDALSEVPLGDDGATLLQLRSNFSSAPYDTGRCLHDMFARQAGRTPDRIAVRSDERSFTYAQLQSAALRVARYLQHCRVRPGDIVAISMDRSPEYIAAILGILNAGAAYLPIEVSFPASRKLELIADARPVVLFAADRNVPEVMDGSCRVVGHGVLRAVIDKQGGATSLPVVSSAAISHVFYTSGSTGAPKGVLGSHRSAVNNSIDVMHRHPFGNDEVVAHKTSPAWIASVQEIFATLFSGAELLILNDEVLLSPRRLIERLHIGRVSRVFLPPALLSAMLDSGEPIDLPHLRLVFTGGDPPPASLVRNFSRLLPHATLLNAYGSTEVVGDATACPLTGVPPHPSAGVPIGVPISNTQAYVLDEAMHICPPGVPGEIYAGGDSLAYGYLGDPALTAAKFVPDPFAQAPGQRLYRTGDRAKYAPDGSIIHLGRLDRQLQIRGCRVELAEVEQKILGFPAVKRCICRPGKDPQGADMIVAYLQMVEPGARGRDIQSFLKGVMPVYMVPARICVMDEIPLTANGKVDVRALEAAAAEATHPEEYAPPLSELETSLGRIWAEVLGLQRVGRESSFFDLGGHSLLLSRVRSALESRHGVSLQMIELFEHPTIAALAAHISGKRAADASVNEGMVRGRRQAASFAARRAARVRIPDASGT